MSDVCRASDSDEIERSNSSIFDGTTVTNTVVTDGNGDSGAGQPNQITAEISDVDQPLTDTSMWDDDSFTIPGPSRDQGRNYPMNSTEIEQDDPSLDSTLQSMSIAEEADGNSTDKGGASFAVAADTGSSSYVEDYPRGAKIAAEIRRRLEKSRIDRYDLGLDPTSPLSRPSEISEPTEEPSYVASREKCIRLRKVRHELEKKVDQAIDDKDTQDEIVIVMEKIAAREIRGCRTAEEFMELSKLTDVQGRVLQGMISSTLSVFGGVLRGADVAKAAAENPRKTLAILRQVRKSLKAAKMATMPMLLGKTGNVAPGRLGLSLPPRAVLEKKPRAKRDKEVKRAVVPERAADEVDCRRTDPTSLGVMAMHEKLRVAKKMPMFELVRDPKNDVEKTALNSHILAILLDRQLARTVAAEPGTKDPMNSVMVYYVAKKAAESDVRAQKKLAEDVEQGWTWITRWDRDFLRNIQNRCTDDWTEDYLSPDEEADDANGRGASAQADGGGSVSGNPGPSNSENGGDFAVAGPSGLQRASAGGRGGVDMLGAPGGSGYCPNQPPVDYATGLGVPGPSGVKQPRAKKARRQ